MVPDKAAVLSRALAAAAWLVICAAPMAAGPDAEQYEVRTFRSTVDGSDQPYALYAPQRLERDKRYPLIISLHGAGQTHRQGLRQVFGVKSGDALPETGYFVAAPLGRGSLGYEGIAEADVFDTLEQVKIRYPIDEDRIYLTGVSMGGSGTLSIALRRPDVWAAIAVVCGGAPAGTPELAGNALNLPVHLFHGDADTVVPVETGRRWHEDLKAAASDVTYREFRGEGHNIAPLAYKDGYVFRWFEKHRRNRVPQAMSFTTPSHRYNAAYWLRVDSFEPGRLATISGKVRERVLALRTADVYGLTIDLSQMNIDRLDIDGTQIPPEGMTVHLIRGKERWQKSPAALQDGKRLRFEGPPAAVLALQHSYVYGTSGMQAATELWSRAELAQRAADWSGRKARPSVSFPVVSDIEAVSSTGNLVVFGTTATNKLLQAWSGKLPMELKPDAAEEYGLVFTAPARDRMVLVSSGLPWWTGATEEQKQGFRYQWLSLPYRVLIELPEYVLFHRSIGNIVASGTFDRNWRLRPGDAQKLGNTGVIRLVP